MKIYTNEFELTKPSVKKVWTPQHSDYAIGVKITKDGIAQDNSGLSVFDGDTCLSAEANEIAGNKIYKMSSGDPSVKTLDVRYYKCETPSVDISTDIVTGVSDKIYELGNDKYISLSSDILWTLTLTGDNGIVTLYIIDKNSNNLKIKRPDNQGRIIEVDYTTGQYDADRKFYWGSTYKPFGGEKQYQYADCNIPPYSKIRIRTNASITNCCVNAKFANNTSTTQGNFKLQVEATDTTVYDIDEKGETFNLPTASASVKGGIKVGANLSVDSDGVLNANAPTPEYTLPTASASTLGGVKINGNNLVIAADGTLSASGGGSSELPIASSSTLGGVKIGSNVSISADGTISVSNKELEIYNKLKIQTTQYINVATTKVGTSYQIQPDVVYIIDTDNPLEGMENIVLNISNDGKPKMFYFCSTRNFDDGNYFVPMGSPLTIYINDDNTWTTWHNITDRIYDSNSVVMRILVLNYYPVIGNVGYFKPELYFYSMV